jgi:imidazolonepropionase-like amidohydrolase
MAMIEVAIGFLSRFLARVATLALLAGAALAQEAETHQRPITLFENVRVFDAEGATLSEPVNVLIRGHLIERIAKDPIAVDPDATTIIKGGGRTLMPGLIDAHWHTMLVRPTPAQTLNSGAGYLNLVAGVEATATLMRGFTTVRDMGGPSFDLKRAIDDGLVPGPRIYPSGAMISVTSGHGDFRSLTDLPRPFGAAQSRIEQVGGAMIADSPDEVRLRVREQLMQGASQIKLTAGGGVASPFSPLDVSTFTEAELRAAVEAAENWGTFVCTHAYTPTAIQRAIRAGVKCIEHGHLMDEATARMMAERDIWLSTQPFLADAGGGASQLGAAEQAKKAEVVAGTDNVYRLARKHRLKTAFGTDILFSQSEAQQQGSRLAALVRWYTPAEVLKMATADNAQLLTMTGLRNPYPGKLGVVAEGALADLLLVDGDPIEDIALVADPRKNFLIIMKNGTIYKNTLAN